MTTLFRVGGACSRGMPGDHVRGLIRHGMKRPEGWAAREVIFGTCRSDRARDVEIWFTGSMPRLPG
jgi:hypothetical protein